MPMKVIQVVYGDALVLDPRMGFEFSVYLSPADAEFGRDALVFKQPPKRKRFFQACRAVPNVANRGVHHAHGESRPLVIGQQASRVFLRSLLRMPEKAKKGSLRGSKTANLEADRNQGQEYCRAQESSARF
jgi:hypothetical protein